MEEVPANYKTAGILMLIAGILNILVGLLIMFILGIYGLGFGVATFGIGFVIWCCCVLPIAQLGVGVVELLTGINMMNGKPVAKANVISIIGIVVGALSAGLGTVPMILEIIATVMLNDKEVKAWLETASEELLLED